MRYGLLMLLVVASSWWSLQVQAHQLKTAITTVLFNERTGNIEVMHRFYLHDAEHAIEAVVGKGADLHGDETTRDAFSDYVMAHFAMQTLAGEALDLKTVGYQIDGPHFWVYQETAIPTQLNGLSLRHNSLQEVWSDQENMVNIERRVSGKQVVQTVNFTNQDDWLEVAF